MGKVLVVAEKPSVGSDIAKALVCTEKHEGYYESDQYIVTWAVGHLVGLKYPEEHDEKYKEWKLEDLPLVFPLSESLKILPETAKQFSIIKKLINREDVDSLVNAGDAGREGLLIQEWIYRLSGNRKPIQMLWISSFTDQAIKQAFNGNLKKRSDFMSLLTEAEARAEGDHLLGINYSRLLTLTRAAQGTSLSYGRCQTPLLNLIVQREREIAGFKPEPFYNIEVKYAKGFNGVLVDQEEKRVNLHTPEEVKDILSSLQESGTVISCAEENKSKKAPLLYNLAELQKAMGKQYKYTPDQTLQIAQRLYEKHKILSYPRTDSRCLSTDIYQEIDEHLKSCNFGDFAQYINKLDFASIKADKSYFDDLKVSDHHALIPTINPDMGKTYAKLSPEEKNVFDEVVKSFISIFYPNYKYSVTKLIVDVGGYRFLSKGTTIVSLGYKEVLKMEPGESDKPEEKEEKQILPKLARNEIIGVDSTKAVSQMTKPPARYTVSSVISVMEKYNIGTSATRADIVKRLQNPKREFIRLEKGKYYATNLGKAFIDIVPEELKDVKLTERFEQSLAAINEGTLTKEEFLHTLQEDLQSNIKKFSRSISDQEIIQNSNARPVIGKCPKCGKDVFANEKAYGCSGYKEGCDFVIWKSIAGKAIPEALARQLLTKGYTTTIKGFKNKAGRVFNAALVLKPDKTVGLKF